MDLLCLDFALADIPHTFREHDFLGQLTRHLFTQPTSHASLFFCLTNSPWNLCTELLIPLCKSWHRSAARYSLLSNRHLSSFLPVGATPRSPAGSARSWATVTDRGARRVERFPLPTRQLQESWARDIRTRYSPRSINREQGGREATLLVLPSISLFSIARATPPFDRSFAPRHCRTPST